MPRWNLTMATRGEGYNASSIVSAQSKRTLRMVHTVVISTGTLRTVSQGKKMLEICVSVRRRGRGENGHEPEGDAH